MKTRRTISALILAAVLSAATGHTNDDADARTQARAELAQLTQALSQTPNRIDLLQQQLRLQWFLAVDSETRLQAAQATIDRLQVLVASRTATAATVQAYAGSLDTLRAKHAFWPRHKLTYLREGLAALDAAVASAPTVFEVRYVRLMTCFYLPRIFGRTDSVQADLDALADLMIARGQALDVSPELLAEVADFVLTHGELAPNRKLALAALSARVQSGESDAKDG